MRHEREVSREQNAVQPFMKQSAPFTALPGGETTSRLFQKERNKKCAQLGEVYTEQRLTTNRFQARPAHLYKLRVSKKAERECRHAVGPAFIVSCVGNFTQLIFSLFAGTASRGAATIQDTMVDFVRCTKVTH